MAEDSAELEGLEAQLHRLLSRDPQRGDGQRFCSDFCTLVERHAARWQLPLPQLRVLQVALCYFTRASTGFTSNCDHVLHTLSSLALSIFELLLFFEQKDFDEEPLKQFSKTFQTCHLVLSKLQNVHFLQVERLVRGGGPWASPALQAILSESSLPQNEVDGCIGAELPVFFELRVHYLLSRRRVTEAMALARRCARHPAAGRHSFFLQVYLTWLHKTSQHDRLQREVAAFNGKDAVHIICSLECEEEDELLLALCTAFLSQQLRRGDLYYLCDLVLVWTKLHSRLNTSKRALLQESHRLMLSATNVSSIFPFIRALLQEVGEAGVQFCVELCANALQSRLPCDAATKSLIYKTMAGLLPSDLEVCRACALLVFFLERSVESYKTVYLLYMHPDQEYHVDSCPIGNHVRFETLQILKKDLCFDPEFWNLIALRTSCLKLMSEKLVSAALEEIMEDKWISNYCTKESAFRSAAACQRERRRAFQAAEKKRRHKDTDADAASKRLKVVHAGRKKGYQGSRPLKEASSEPLRRSFWQLDRLRDNGEHRRTTRLSEKNPQKRRIRKPRWLLEDSGTLEENSVPLKMKKHQKHQRSAVIGRSDGVPFKNDVKHKPPVAFDVKSKENGIKHQKEFSLDGVKASPAPQVVLELSLPDNELLGTFTEESCSRQRGLPQVLLYKHTVKFPEAPQPAKAAHGKEVILRARDVAMLVQQLHCYSRKQKGKGVGPNAHGSVSTITRSSVQGSPPKDPPPEAASASEEEPPQPPAARAVLRKLSSAREVCEEPAVEMKVTIASPSPVLDKVCNAGGDEASPTPTGDRSPPVLEKVTDTVTPQPEKVVPGGGDGEQTSPSLKPEGDVLVSRISSAPPADQDDVSTLTLVTEMVRELSPERLAGGQVNDRRHESGNCVSEETNNLHKMASTSSCLVPEQEVSLAGSRQDVGLCVLEDGELDDSEPETEESKLEYCCTFCNKDFKGRRVVEHAMFHYRRDECMFCGVAFKDDLLAMMHLSDHIEKLKKLKEPPGDKVKAKRLTDTKDTSTAKTSAKGQPRNESSERRGRPRKSTRSPPPEDSRSKSRTLRSNNKAADEPPLGSTVHRFNGHAGRRKELKRLKHNLKAKISQEIKSERATNHKLRKHREAATPQHRKSSEDQVDASSSPEVLEAKQEQKAGEDERVAPEEKVLCPVDGCSWRKDLSKNRVALLYHALDDHHGDLPPLQLAFSVDSGKCSICKRVLWSFQHFLHHVERHRLTPRHPCLHQGCSARFKTGNEMRRHARKHSPLQAACCLPGCPRLFICLWALNLHEREHYAQRVHAVDARRHASKPPKSKDDEQTSSRKRREKPAASRENEGNVLKNLSNKDTKPSAPYRRLRFREAAGTPPKVHKGISSFLIAHSRKLRHKLKKKQARVNEKGPKRRGRPPKVKRDENAAAHKEATVARRDQKRSAPSPPKTDEETKQIPVKPAETNDESKLRRPVERSHVEENGSFQQPATAPEHKAPKPNAARQKKSHTESHRGPTRMLKKNHHVSSALKKRAKTVSTVQQPESKAAAAAGVEGSNEVKPAEPGDCELHLPTTSTEEHQDTRESEGKPTMPQDKSEKTQTTTEKPQSVRSEEKPKKRKEKTRLATEKFQNLQSEVKPRKRTEKTPITTEEPQSVPSEEKPKKRKEKPPMTSKKSQNLQSEEKPKKPQERKEKTQTEKTQMEKTQTEKTQTEKTQTDKTQTEKTQTTTEKPQNLQSEEKPTIPQDKTPITTEEPQSVQSEGKPKKRKEKTPMTSKKSQNLQSEEKPKKPQKRKDKAGTTTEEHSEVKPKKRKDKAGATTEEHSEVKPKKRKDKAGATTEEHSEVKPKKRKDKAGATTEEHSEVKPKKRKDKAGATTEEHSEVKPKKRKDKAGATTEEHSEVKPKKRKDKAGATTEEHSEVKPKKRKDKAGATTEEHSEVKPQKRKDKTSSDVNKNKNLNKKLDKKSAKEKRPCETPVPSKCEVKQPGGADGGAAAAASGPPEDGGTAGGSSGKPKKSKAVKKSEPSRAKRKSEVVGTDDRTDVREQRDDGSKPSEPESPAQLLQEVEERVEENSSPDTPPPQTAAIRRRGANDGNFSVCNEMLKQYNKRPYLRLPPTVYLDERFITMPKRRKEMSSFSEAPPTSSAPPEPAASPLQRQRCANCFTTFHCARELQRHLALKTCSTFFGFDSDNDD